MKFKRIKASANEGTPEGDFLSFLFYRTHAIIGMLNINILEPEFYGCPHNGGQHTLFFLIGDRFKLEDVQAFLEIIEETYHEVPGCMDFTNHVRAQNKALSAA